MAKVNFEKFLGQRLAWEVDYGSQKIRYTGLCVGYSDYSELPPSLRTLSPSFDLLILHDGDAFPDYVSGDNKFHILRG